jgi:hypothetical protein
MKKGAQVRTALPEVGRHGSNALRTLPRIGNLAEKCESGRLHNGPERQPVELGYHLHVACLDGDYMIQTPFHSSAGGSA